MSDTEFRLARIESLLEKLLAAKPQPAKAAYRPDEFAALVGRSTRWVQARVSTGLIPRIKIAGTRNTLIPASALESFRAGK